ncbi:hypothetical protein G436_3997 [Leptospira interrogans serovar Hardjo str. Norma]|uniref:Uncharacterized protein n=1 Tax=Leptospira interrogans serovar Hardjo str. Norma TaxID=1279460 RepID=A0A0M5LBZ3_LEPIR|nr:hypothetical protein G436_3997 [Leptospira interrogans serovar Hardjo str. Norma]
MGIQLPRKIARRGKRNGYKQKRQNAGADFVSVPLHSFIQLLILKDVKQ